MKKLKDISIRYKFISIIILIFFVIAGIAFSLFSITENRRQKNAIKHETLLLVRYTSEYSSAPLFFRIKKETSEILQILNSSPNIEYTAIYDKQGNLFDSYNPKSTNIPLTITDYPDFDSLLDGNKRILPYASNTMLVKQKIFYQKANIGTIILKVSMLKTEEIIRKNIRIAAVINLLMLVIALLLGYFFQRLFTHPIVKLANISDEIKRNADYSIRLKKNSNDEIGLLYDRFNNMLEQIEIRDKKRDYTERMLEEAKNQAEKADKLKSAFLANMSHEIRTPMNSIVGFAELLADEEISTADKKEFFELINASCATLLHLIDDILDISKIEAGQTKIVKNQCNLSTILNEVYLSFKDLNQKSNNEKVQLNLNILEVYSNLVVETDEIRLKQILTNLLSNAIKFTNDGSIDFGLTVVERIMSHERKKFIKFFVKDTGIGIDEETQKVIFERFTKIESDNNKLHRGAGLGLTISKKFIELLGGEIWVDSMPGKGSTFYFTIPANIESVLQKLPVKIEIDSVIRPEEPNLKDKLVLVVEDDATNFELLKIMLRRTGADIKWVDNGSKAIEFCKAKVPNIIFMDIKMPEMDGFEALKHLREMEITVPVIAQTAFARIEDQNDILKAGFDGYLSKPIERNKLTFLLNELFPKYTQATR
jgi:signal transduction histidine kinase/ActR/RegA family two-component response regulator